MPAPRVSLVSTVLLEAGGEPLLLFELKGIVFALMTALEKTSAHVHIPRAHRDYEIEVGLRMLNLRNLIEVDGDSYRMNPREAALVRDYTNAIAHLVPEGDGLLEAPKAAE